MCLNKIYGFFLKREQPSPQNAQEEKLKQESFNQQVEEVLNMAVIIDGEKFLIAKELLEFMGVELERLMEDTSLWDELKEALVVYKLRTSKDDMHNIYIEPSYTKASKSNVGTNIHYAFNENIVGFLKKHYTNPTDVHLVSTIETAYKKLKK